MLPSPINRCRSDRRPQCTSWVGGIGKRFTGIRFPPCLIGTDRVYRPVVPSAVCERVDQGSLPSVNVYSPSMNSGVRAHEVKHDPWWGVRQ